MGIMDGQVRFHDGQQGTIHRLAVIRMGTRSVIFGGAGLRIILEAKDPV